MFFTVNIWAILTSALASMIIGSIWFGPLFGKIFMKTMGMDSWSPEKQAKMKKAMPLTFLSQFIANLVMFYFLGVVMNGLDKNSLTGGVEIALLIWTGFIVPVKLGDALWGGKMILFWLGAGNMLVTIVTGGVIIGLWK